MLTVIQFPDKDPRVVPKEVAVPETFKEISTRLGASALEVNTLPHEFGSSSETNPVLVNPLVTEVPGFGSPKSI
jgi:antitoxin component HigA of HigAB toxin-antitoxin module